MADLTRVAEVLARHHAFLVYETDDGEQGHAACSCGQGFGVLAYAITHQAQMLADAGLVATETETEWGVLQPRVPGLHRGPWSEQEARVWLAECEEDGFRLGAFVLARREVTPWRTVENDHG